MVIKTKKGNIAAMVFLLMAGKFIVGLAAGLVAAVALNALFEFGAINFLFFLPTLFFLVCLFFKLKTLLVIEISDFFSGQCVPEVRPDYVNTIVRFISRPLLPPFVPPRFLR